MKYIVPIGVLIIILAAIALGVSHRSSTSGTTSVATTSTSSSTMSAQSENAVTIKGYAFSPETLTVKKGTTVTWTNQDLASHTITADTALATAPASQLFGKGEQYSYTFSAPGTFAYHCEPHPYMKATIIVNE